MSDFVKQIESKPFGIADGSGSEVEASVDEALSALREPVRFGHRLNKDSFGAAGGLVFAGEGAFLRNEAIFIFGRGSLSLAARLEMTSACGAEPRSFRDIAGYSFAKEMAHLRDGPLVNLIKI